MRLIASKALTSACLTALGLLSSGCGAGANVTIPESLKAPCESTVEVLGAQTIGDLGNAIVQGDADLRVCSVKKDAVVAIAEAQNAPWWAFWR